MSTQLDPTQYIIAPSLEEYFVDKATGLPLSGGWVYFYSDINRTTLKPIFELSGSPGSYTYTQIPNPMQLTSVGTASDGMGNDIKIYYYPYDANGNIELYFIQVYANNNGVPGAFQWSRSAWPNSGSSLTNSESVINYVANGQFLLHNAIAATDTAPAGQISKLITYIAPGGWSLQRPTNNATDNISFTQLGPTVNPAGSPRYVCRIIDSVPAVGDSYKNLIIQFPDVNSFNSSTQQYTFAFTGLTNGSGSTNISFGIYKNFGMGGSSPVTTSGIATFSVTSAAYTIYQVPFVFGSNVGKTIGANNDDYVQLVLSLPTSAQFDVSLTDFILTVGNVNITLFPNVTNGEMIINSTLGYLPTPSYTGSDLYLPLKLTQQGLIADQSEVGTIVGKVEYSTFSGSISTISNELICDGATYETKAYSPLGIPYARLQSKLFNSSFNVPIYGTGAAFATANIAALATGALNEFHIATNTSGAVTASADVSTTFTITTICTSVTTTYKAGMLDSDSLVSKAAVDGISFSVPGAGTTSFTFSNLVDNINAPYIFQANVVAPTAGEYWTFANASTSFYMWFKVDGSGANPAPGGTGIELDLLTNYTINETTGLIGQALSGSQITKIVTVAASSIPNNSYFTFNTTTNNYYVWYRKNGSGTDPAPSNKIGIVVDILSTDTDVQVCSKTVIAINSAYFAVPQFEGLFLRGFDPNEVWDYLAGFRFGLSNISDFFGNTMLGTLELSDFYSHTHTASSPSHTHTPPGGQFATSAAGLGFDAVVEGAGGGTRTFQTTSTEAGYSATAGTAVSITVDPIGNVETRPVNGNILWVIKY